MNKTIQIVRGLFNLRIYNRVFTSEFCTSHKRGKDPGEKDGNSSETLQKSDDQKSKVSQNKIKVDGLKREEKINLSSRNEVTNSDQIAQTKNINIVDNKVEPVKSVVESDKSSTQHFPKPNKNLKVNKLSELIHDAPVDHDVEANSESGAHIQNELSAIKKDIETQQKLKPGVSASSDTFASLLRKSAFVELGDPVNKLVVGKIYFIVDDDLYIDFGWKFPAVCRRPRKNPEVYNIGAKVLLRIKDLELTAKFLGDKEYTSLLEADCEIIHRINEDGSKFIAFKQ